LVAEIRASSLRPESAATATWIGDVAPEMFVQPLPSAAQRSHWYANVAGVFQLPVVVESFLPTAATPERAGRPVAAGNGTTTSPAAATYADDPFTFWALTVERTYSPPSAVVAV
jgi:hypothetical protein